MEQVMKKITAGMVAGTIALVLAFAIGIAGTQTAYADDAVEYQEASWNDANKQVVYAQKTASSYTAVTSDMGTSWGNGWYVDQYLVSVHEIRGAEEGHAGQEDRRQDLPGRSDQGKGSQSEVAATKVTVQRQGSLRS